MKRWQTVSWRSALLLSVLALFASGCPGCDQPVEGDPFFDPAGFGQYEFDGEPDIEAPERVLFGDVEPGRTVTRTAEIRNAGRETLKVSEWTISDGFELAFANRLDAPDEIRPGDAEIVAITFTAFDDSEFRGTLTIGSNDPDEPEVVIDLFANAKFPCLETVPDDVVDFGEVDPDDRVDRIVEIRNCSPNAPTTFAIEGISGDREFDFAREPEFERMTLGIGESVSVVIAFAPTAAGSYEATLDIESDDEFRPRHSLELRGIGAQGQCPTPVIVASHPERGEAIARPSATLDALPLDRIRLTAAESIAYDDKTIASYSWSLVRKPADSGTTLSQNATSLTNELYLDLAGEYIVELEVTDNEDVRSCAAARMTVRATANEDIHIQLVWDTPNDPDQFDSSGSDVDLHLLHPQGVWNDDPYDCFWQNLIPDWGQSRPAGIDSLDCERDSSRQGCHDDPSLDIDDVDGWGPENINLNNPENNSRYAVGIHYFSDHSYGVSYATTRIYVGGILRAEYRRQRLLHNEFWYVADIDWPSAAISANGQVFPTFPQ